MDLKQTIIYDYLPTKDDELFSRLSKLSNGSCLEIGSCIVSLNEFGLYEVSNIKEEVVFSDVHKCYKYLYTITL